MARATSNYDPENYGRKFALIPEGLNQFKILGGLVEYDAKGNQWKMELEHVKEAYKSDYPLNCWLNEEGCVNAIFDAAGVDPASAEPDKDYQPHNFKNVVVWAEVYHKDVTKTGKNGEPRTFTNARIGRLYPAFHLGAPEDGFEGVPASGGADEAF